MLLFKNLELTNYEMLWLKAIYENKSIPDTTYLKFKLHSQIPAEFNYTNLHRTFLWDDRLNVFGIWIVNSKDPIFKKLDKVIKAIKAQINENYSIKTISATEISKLTEISVEDSIISLGYLVQHPGFVSAASRKGIEFGQDLISFTSDSHIDAYLNYKDIPTLLERTWAMHRMDLYIRPEKAELTETEVKPKLRYTKLCHSVFFGTEIWTFHENSAQVVKALINASKIGLTEVNLKDIHPILPKEFDGQTFSQIFKRNDKNTAWKKLIIAGPTGRGFYQINPKYLINGLEEVSLNPKD